VEKGLSQILYVVITEASSKCLNREQSAKSLNNFKTVSGDRPNYEQRRVVLPYLCGDAVCGCLPVAMQ
jgi:hypothetical protein